MAKMGIWARSLGASGKSTRRHPKLRRAAGVSFENMENRTMLSLLGISPGYPSIFYDTTGKMTYAYDPIAAQGALVATAKPRTFSLTPAGPTVLVNNGILPASLTLTLTLDSSGNIIPTAGPNLIIDGKFTVNAQTYDGILLEGDIEQFGFAYTGSTTNAFDYRLKLDPVNPGLMAPFYGSDDIGIAMLSAASSFTGSFTTDFTGGTPQGAGANGNVGPIPQLPPPLASLAGYVYEDANNDGVFAGPDSPLPGVEVDLSGSDFQGNPVSTVTHTGPDGSYHFDNLEPSGPNGYTIDEIQATVPPPLLDGKDSVGTLGGSNSIKNEFHTIPLAGGQNGVFYDFGEIPPGNISGTVYCDANTDNAFETGTDDSIGGALLTLSGTDDLGNGVTLIQNSASDGSYNFAGLRPGTYSVSVSNSDSTHTLETSGSIGPAALPVGGSISGDNFGYVQLTPVSGQVINDNTSAGINGVNVTLTGMDYTHAIVGPITVPTSGNGNFSFGALLPGTYTITEGAVAGFFPDQNNTGVSTFGLAGCDNAAVVATFGEIPPASLSGTKYNDQSGDGITSDDIGLGGVKIDLFENGGSTPVATTTTAPDGSYSFNNLLSANYSVQEEVPGGWVQTAGVGGYSVIATAGSSSSGNNFADFKLLTISGIKYADITGNGFSNDDTVQGGVVVDLFLNGGSTPIASTTTAVNGSYTFSNLGPGTYTVREEAPAGTLATGGAGGYTTTATSGLVVTNDNFDNFQLITISGKKFNDITGDGFTSDDTAQGGVTINLYLNGGSTPIATTTTASDGSYSFANLGPGSYSVQEVVPTGSLQTGGIGGYTITATSGVNVTNDNFDNFQLITISGKKFNDITGNGFSSDDTAQGGVTINLYLNGGSTPIATTTTASDGSYSFANLGPGTYSVQELVPTGSVQTGGTGGYTTTATSGLNITNDNFDNFQFITISGKKFNDITGNGFSSDDTALGGVTINLFKNGGTTAIATTTTASDGSYSFANLGPGSYSVQEAIPTGSTQTGGIGGYSSTATSGANVAGDNFDDFQNISISGKKYNDLTDNGITSDDTGLGGVTINLYKNGGTTPAATTVTASDGTYSFTNLGPGSYSVKESVPAGWIQTAGTAGYSIAAQSGTNSTGNNFADFLPISISGTKFTDITGNGFSSDDTVLSGVTINLYKNGGTSPFATTTTTANGTYSFTNLAAATYTVQEVVPAGWTQTGGNSGYSITGVSGAAATGENFDDFKNTSISGAKYKDITGNSFSSDDTVLGGVTVNLYKNGGASPVATTTTASNGTYSFTNLGPGSYSVQEVVPTGWTQTGGIGGYTFIPTSGSANTGKNFDDFQNISISGTKYNDLTDNGYTTDDTGLSGVTINLFKNGGSTPVSSTITTSNGTYSFTNLGPGTYSVQEVVPAGWVQTAGIGGYTVSATCSTNVTGKNFADFQLLTISGIKYQDLTGNGFSSDDTPLGGVTIQLFKDTNKDGLFTSADGAAIATTVTASGTGAYSFGNLLPGTYFVQEVVPTGWIETGPATTTYYKVTATATTKTYAGNNFDDYFEECKLSNTSSYYFLINNSTTHYTTLGTNVHEGDQVTVVFNLLSPDTISLVSYTAPSATWVPAQAPQQVLFDSATGSFTAGTHSLTITIPMCYFQIDFVCGTVINVLGAPGSNILYNSQNRMFQSDNGGTDAQFTGGGSVAGYVFNDADKNKLMGSGDIGLAGVVVTLTGTDSLGHSVKLIRMTDATGYYYFKGLRAGTYSLTETQPSGYTDSAAVVGTIASKATGKATSANTITTIALTTSSAGLNYDFGELKSK